jgi:hypothetical protein
MFSSHIEKCISKVIWETLSRARHEKLAWDGEENEASKVGKESENIFFTPPQTP